MPSARLKDESKLYTIGKPLENRVIIINTDRDQFHSDFLNNNDLTREELPPISDFIREFNKNRSGEHLQKKS